MKRVFLSLLLVVTLVAPACEREAEKKDVLLGYVTATEAVARKFEYFREHEGNSVKVTGAVEDGFRYQGLLELDGAQVVEAIVDDDALALKVIDASKIPSLAEGATPSSQVISDALRAGIWIVDPSGASQPRTGVESQGPQDPIEEAVGIFRYVRAAINAALEVKQYREDDLDPAYRPTEDNFPKPDEKEGIRRFDLVRPILPTGDVFGGLEQLPQAPHFRRMAVYVKGNRILRILEEVDVDGHPEFVEAREKNRQRLLDLLRAIKEAEGAERVIPRRMSVEFGDFGDRILVRQPQDALTASLSGVLVLPGAEIQPVLPPAEDQPAASPEPAESPAN